MPITIARRKGHGVTWVVNSLFSQEFPAAEKVFEIPSLSWMVYLHKDFELLEATDENDNPLDLSPIKHCCGGDYIKLTLSKNIVITENKNEGEKEV